jgi:hypothetical protein
MAALHLERPVAGVSGPAGETSERVVGFVLRILGTIVVGRVMVCSGEGGV